MTSDVRFTLSVGDTTQASKSQLDLSKRNGMLKPKIHLFRMTNTLSIVSHKNYNLNANKGFVILLTFKLIACFIDCSL
jgi:hypothetical protein